MAGAAGVGKAIGVAAASPLRRAAASIAASHTAGVKAGFTGTGGTTTQGTLGGAAASGGTVPASGAAPGWAQGMRGRAMKHGATTAAHAVRAGDSRGGGASVSLSESNRT